MSSNEMEDEIDTEVPAKRMKIEVPPTSPQSRKLSIILQREIEKEINLRSADLENIEENIFLTKQCLLKLRQGVVSDYYKEKTPKDSLQYPPHPAVQDTFLGKTPRKCQKPVTQETQPPVVNEEPESKEVPEKKRRGRKSSQEKNAEATPPKEFKPPCYIHPKPFKVETVKPSEPRGYNSKKQIRIIVGNVSKWLAPDESSRATHKWTVYTKSTDVDLSSFLSKVIFFLHPSYKPNDVVSVLGPPFKLTRRGWGEFPLKARFHFKNPLDTPVDVVHVLKLDDKHTGFETFGSETTLTVWIHLPNNDENEPSVSEDLVKTEAHSEEENQKVAEETVSRCCRKKKKKKKKKENESLSVKKIDAPADVSNRNDCPSETALEVETDINKLGVHIKEEPSSPHVVPDNTDFVCYDENVVSNIKHENYSDSLEFLVKQEDKDSELSQLSNAFIEEVIKAGFVPEEFDSVGNVKLNSENNSCDLNNIGAEQTINPTKDGLNIHVKAEPELFISGQQESYQDRFDDYLDECNVVESEVIISCDDDPPQNYEEAETLETKESLNSFEDHNELRAAISAISTNENNQTNYISNLLDTPTKSPEIIRNSFSANLNPVFESNVDCGIKIIELSSLLKNNKNVLNTKHGITQINSLQEIAHPSNLNELNPSSSSFHIKTNSGNQKKITNNIVCQSIQKKTFPEKSIKPVIAPRPEQLNSIEITDNGKTLAAGLFPVVKVNDNPNNISFVRSVPRKVFVRKLNGEVATYLAPVSQEVLSKTLKLTTSQVNAVDSAAPKIVTSNSQSSLNHKDIIMNNYKVVKNLGSISNIGKTQNIPVINPSSNSLQPSLCIPSKSSSFQNVSIPLATTKFKRKHNSNKEVKSTIIMLQKENGEVILKKEAKFCDFKDEINSSGSFKKGHLEGTSSSGNRKGNGKKITGALESMSLLSFSKCQSNNINPSLIKLQQPISSNCSSSAKTAESPLGQKIFLNKNCKIASSDLKKVLLKSSLLKKNIEKKEATTKKQEIKNLSKDLDDSILLNCPTQTTEAAVAWLIKKIPLVDKRAEFPAFKCQFPFCAKSREEFLNWPYAKQRAAEWTRSKRVVKYLNKLNTIEDKWTTLQVYDWARIRAFTPMKIDDSIEAPGPSNASSSDIPFFYVQPNPEIITCIKKCRDLKEMKFVDVETIDEEPKCKKSGPDTFVPSREKEFKFNLSSAEENSLFEPELDGLRKFINNCQKNVGAVSSPEFISPGISYSAAERLLISAFHSVAEDVIRRSYNASWVRHDNRPPPTITPEDVKMAILSRKELDFLVPLKVEKKERPPVTVLPNFS